MQLTTNSSVIENGLPRRNNRYDSNLIAFVGRHHDSMRVANANYIILFCIAGRQLVKTNKRLFTVRNAHNMIYRLME